MAQLPIREYDAKRLWASVSWTGYQWVLVETEEQRERVVEMLGEPPLPPPSQGEKSLRVVKPDQLFGKRGKLWLVGVKLDAQWVKDWIDAHRHQETTINGVSDRLHTFLIEPFVPHQEEYYLSLSTERDADVLRFSVLGWVEIEEQWESVREVRVGVLEELSDDMLPLLFVGETLKCWNVEPLKHFIKQFFQFFRKYGFSTLEVNPFVLDDHGEVQCLDMVAKVDTCEAWRQKERGHSISRVKPFGTKQHPSEMLVEEVDSKTGASLKLTVINPDGRLWFLLWWGGASVIVMDTLAQRGLLHEVGNYGELSGNPDEESNRAYVKTLIETMLANGKSDQYLCLIGGIANFTDIVALVKPLTTVLRQYAEQLRAQRITILMRRGWLRVEQAMSLLETTCTELWLSYKILDDEHGLTEVLEEIKI